MSAETDVGSASAKGETAGFNTISGVLILAGVLACELVLIALLYKHNFEFVCRDVAPAWTCAALSGAIVRVVAMIGVASVILIARREILGVLRAGLHTGTSPWLGVHAVGFFLLLAPWFFISDNSSSGAVSAGFALWILGGLAAAIGAALALVTLEGWRSALRVAGPVAIGGLGVAAFAPEIAGVFQNVWKFDPVTEFTFSSVQSAILALGYEVFADPPTKELIVGDFGVLVGPQCSGVEGFLLITSFLGFYIWLFREQLKFPRVLILLPIGVVLSWCFNVVRLVTLILLGHHVSPDLAINGFHSHAGWLMFTIVAVGLALAAHALPWFRRDGGAEATKAAPATAPPPAFREDPYVAQIFPFLVFMASALLASTFFEVPAVAYPLRFMAMVAGLCLAIPYLRRLEWRLDPLAIAAGIGIGVLWILTSPVEAEPSPLAIALTQMSAGMLAIWVVTRVLGTTLLVPAIEELFFRGYVLRRIDNGSLGWRIFAIAVSTALFAALHGRWLEAGLAGMIFALLMLRKNRLADAIIAHMIANAVIAAWALYQGDWSVI